MNPALTAIEVAQMLGDNITSIVYDCGYVMFSTPFPSLDSKTLQ